MHAKPVIDSKTLLNAVQKLFIDFANSEGIVLSDHFKSTDAFKQFVIGFTVKSLTDAGVPVATATDLALGDGAYESIANSVWEHHNS